MTVHDDKVTGQHVEEKMLRNRGRQSHNLKQRRGFYFNKVCQKQSDSCKTELGRGRKFRNGTTVGRQNMCKGRLSHNHPLHMFYSPAV